MHIRVSLFASERFLVILERQSGIHSVSAAFPAGVFPPAAGQPLRVMAERHHERPNGILIVAPRRVEEGRFVSDIDHRG